MNTVEIKELFAKCDSKSDVCRKLNLPINGSGLRQVDKLILEYNVDTSHFNMGKTKKIKYPIIKKICLICGNEFEAKLGHPREKKVCSHACANTYFRSGKSNPNYKQDDELSGVIKYVKICFRYHERKCVCCDEKNIVEVHHYDGNRNNNKPENLVPLCPTHHQYWHSKFRHIIKSVVDEYVNKFSSSWGVGHPA